MAMAMMSYMYISYIYKTMALRKRESFKPFQVVVSILVIEIRKQQGKKIKKKALREKNKENFKNRKYNLRRKIIIISRKST